MSFTPAAFYSILSYSGLQSAIDPSSDSNKFNQMINGTALDNSSLHNNLTEMKKTG
jgi:hypothetical protein